MVASNDIRIQFLRELLTETCLNQIVEKATAKKHWKVTKVDIECATEGIAGFLGDHFRVIVQLEYNECLEKMHLFIKAVPFLNKPKAQFIDEGNYNRRERMMFKLLEVLKAAEGPNPWGTKTYYYDETMLVMPDLKKEGYRTISLKDTMNLAHVLTVTASLGRFHAATFNYETKKALNNNLSYSFSQEFGDIMEEPTFKDSPMLRAGAKLTANYLKIFSLKTNVNKYNLEENLFKIFLETCSELKEYEDDLNTLLHRDLWVNNLMFKYEKNIPTNALLIDFQLIRYAPPAFDLMLFLYFNTSKKFREENENSVINHYYSIFYQSLDEPSKDRIKDLKYNCNKFYDWCQRARGFALLQATMICPFVLMDALTAQKTFDDPNTFHKYINEDRTEPVVQYAKTCSKYRERILELCEEFYDRYIENVIF